MYSYLQIVEDVLSRGKPREDRTGTGTLSLRSHRFIHDMSLGYPLLTTKTVSINNVLAELLWFLRGSSNVEELRELTYGPNSDKKTIWDANYENQAKSLGYTNGELGPIYGKQFRFTGVNTSSKEVILIDRKSKSESISDENISEKSIVWLEPEEGCGEVFKSTTSGDAITIKKVSKRGEKNSRYLIQFLNTGNLMEASRPSLRYGTFKDKTQSSSKMGIICDIKVPEKIWELWYNLCSRILKEDSPVYHLYGGAGVTMDPRWLKLSNFYMDIQKIPGYYEWCRDPKMFNLDKDYYGSNHYSKDTCVFLDRWYNIALSNPRVKEGIAYKLSFDDHRSDRLLLTLTDIHKLYGIPLETLRVHLLNEGEYYREDLGICVSIVAPPEGKVYRYKRFIDQIKEVLEIAKKDPTSRRLLVSAWNPLDLDISALPPCHMLIKLYIEDGKLDLIFNMRSCDVFLGLPYNIASYAALLLIFSKLLNLEPGTLEGQLTNVHIYSNHITQVQEQVKRKPYKLPKLTLPEFSTLEDVEKLTPKDFTLENYVHHPAIKGDMAV